MDRGRVGRRNRQHHAAPWSTAPARGCGARSCRPSTRISKKASPCSAIRRAVSSSINFRRKPTSCAPDWSAMKTRSPTSSTCPRAIVDKSIKFGMEPAKDLLPQRTGASLFGMLKIEDEEQRMSFKMSCTYCHQVGTFGFRTPEATGRLASHDHAHGRLWRTAPGVEKNDREEASRYLRRRRSEEMAQVDSARSAQGQGTGACE